MSFSASPRRPMPADVAVRPLGPSSATAIAASNLTTPPGLSSAEASTSGSSEELVPGHRGLERVTGDIAGEVAQIDQVLVLGLDAAGAAADLDVRNGHASAPATAGATQVPRSSRAAGSSRTIRRPEPSGSGSRPLQPPAVCTQLTWDVADAADDQAAQGAVGLVGDALGERGLVTGQLQPGPARRRERRVGVAEQPGRAHLLQRGQRQPATQRRLRPVLPPRRD